MKTVLTPISALLLLAALFVTACKAPEDEFPCCPPEEEIDYLSPPAGSIFVPASNQFPGNAAAGEVYLATGNFEESGIPYSIFTQANQGDGNLLNRTGDNEAIPYNYSAIDAFNGVRVVAPNCYSCHAQSLNGSLVIGLGNSLSNFTEDRTNLVDGVDFATNLWYGMDSPEWEAWKPFREATLASSPQLITPFKGVNPASKLTAILAAHRHPETLAWLDEPAFDVSDENLPSDVPAWWLLKKKHAMFLDGSARGDFRKYLMASALLTISDTEKADEVYNQFDDVLSFIYSLSPPDFPAAIQNEKLALGATLFHQHCAKCHGTYGEEESYPNLIIPATQVGTDPLYTLRNGAETVFINWWEISWFGTQREDAYFVYEQGYLAPPLDGVWATAPYLHNGSVPDLASLLDSSKRPTRWKRDFANPTYNVHTVGWDYEVVETADHPEVYDTTLPGFDNAGHLYGDAFSAKERAAVIEYLKTL